MPSIGRLIPALLLGVTGAAGSLAAQEIWLGSGRRSAVSVEFLRPDLKMPGADQSFASAAIFATGRFAIGKRTTLVVELPYAFGRVTYGYYLGPGGAISGWRSTLGNPYVGIEGGRDGDSFIGELGVRAPLFSDNSLSPLLVGTFADLEREDAFLSKVVTVSAFANLRASTPGGFVFRVRGGPLLWVPTAQYVLTSPGGPNSGATELWFAYAVQAGYQSRSATILGGVGGRAILTEDVSNRFIDQLVLAASYRVGGLRPGVSVRLPIDAGRDQIVGSTIGVSLSVDFR